MKIYYHPKIDEIVLFLKLGAGIWEAYNEDAWTYYTYHAPSRYGYRYIGEL